MSLKAARNVGREVGLEPVKDVFNQTSVMAERVGFFARASPNPNKDGHFSRNSRYANVFAFSDSFVRFRPFAPVFGFCRRNDTRRDRLRETLSGIFGQVPTL